MIIKKTKIEGVYVIDLEPREDSRGYFARIFAKDELKEKGVDINIVNINRSLTKKMGTIRGLHYQVSPKSEDKIMQCLSGAIFDVALDLRPNSKTYGKWVGEILSSENRRMLLVPKGFAHGFQILKKDTLVEYFVTQYYAPRCERGIRWNDPFHKIKWPIKNPTVSEKDGNWSNFKK